MTFYNDFLASGWRTSTLISTLFVGVFEQDMRPEILLICDYWVPARH